MTTEYTNSENGIQSTETSEHGTQAASETEEEKIVTDGAGAGQVIDTTEGESGTVPKEEIGAGEYPQGLAVLFVVLALFLGVFVTALDTTIVATAIPRITDEFHSIGDVSWYSSAYFVTTGGFQSAWGKAYKYFPLKITFIVSIAIFEIGSLVSGVASTSLALIVGRAVAGLGGAGISSGAFTIVASAVEPKKRPILAGIIGVSYSIASVVGPLLGGVLTDRVTWRWCFYVNLPIGGVAAVVLAIFFQAPKSTKPVEASLKEKILQMDPIGTVLAMCAVITYILAMQYGGETKPWNSSTVIGLLTGFILIVIAFGVWEYFQGERAACPPRLMRDRNVWSNAIYGMFLGGSYFVVVYYIPIYFQSVDNITPIMSGVRNLPLIIAVSIAIILSSVGISRTGFTTPCLIGGGVMAIIASGLLYTLDIETDTGKWIGYQILGGFGWGLAYQVPIITVQGTADPKDMAPATAIVLFFQILGAAFLVSAAQAAFANQLLLKLSTSAPGVDPAAVVATGATQLWSVFSPDEIPGILIAYMAGLKTAFAVSIGGVGIALVFSLFTKWGRLQSHANTVASSA